MQPRQMSTMAPCAGTCSFPRSGDQRVSPFCSYHPVKNLTIRDHEELGLYREDPFYSIAHVLQHAVAGWSQYLNFLSVNVNRSDVEHSHALATLTYDISSLQEVNASLMENRAIIRSHDMQKWLELRDNRLHSDMVELKEALVEKYDWLIDRCHNLLERTQELANVRALDLAAVSQEKMDLERKSRQIRVLTSLSFLYIPLSFLCSFLGMSLHNYSTNSRILPLQSLRTAHIVASVFGLTPGALAIVAGFLLRGSLRKEMWPRVPPGKVRICWKCVSPLISAPSMACGRLIRL